MTRTEKLDRLMEMLKAKGYPYAAGYLEGLVRDYVPEKYITWHLKDFTDANPT